MPVRQDALLAEWREGPALDPRRPRTLATLIAHACERHRDRPVLWQGEDAWSWQRLCRLRDRLAAAWADRVAAGTTVALLLPNGPAHLLTELTAWHLGAVAAPLAPGLPTPVLAPLLARLQPRLAVLADAAHAALLPPGCTAVTVAEVLAPPAGATHAGRPVAPEQPCIIQHTSGSSGLPRGVILTHDNLASQQAAYAQLWPEVGAEDRLTSYLPWHHSFGGQAERLWALLRGAAVHLVPGGGRDRAAFLACVRAVAPTLFLSVPKLHLVAMQEGLFRPRSLRWAFTAGAPLPQAVHAWYAAREIPLYEGWGLTESSPSAAISLPGRPRPAAVVGPPIPGVRIGIVPGSGRILIQGPNVMRGYLGEADSGLLADPGGPILDSGDCGRWDPAGLVLWGRADAMLKLGNGEKWWAPPWEERLCRPPLAHVVLAVEDGLVAIVDAPAGVSDADVAAVVQAAAPAEPSWARLTAIDRLAAPPSLENGLLTASLKLARTALVARWRSWRSGTGSDFRRLSPAGGCPRAGPAPAVSPARLPRP